MTDTAEQRIDAFDRQEFWDLAYEQLARLKPDPVAWQEYLDEIDVFDVLAGDGLEGEEPYYTPEEERNPCQRHSSEEALILTILSFRAPARNLGAQWSEAER